ncbi:hypothetical protein RSAG8_12216, partial [Rhizoctonia solani AG-8 WAC10335]
MLLAKFPERDPSASDPSPLTYTQEDLERLPERLRQWFRNKSRLPVDPETKQKQRTKSRTHARNLATKRYSQQIKEIARELREADKGLKAMTAFNRATTEFLNELKEDDPEAYVKLQQDAKEMRGASMLDYTELTPDVLASLLDKFPKRLLSDLEQFGKELPVHIWCVKATLQLDTAAPMIYPALRRGARPSLPQVEDIRKVSAHQLRAWLRTYFNYHYIWQGGTHSVPWKVLSRETKFKYIAEACFPWGVKALIRISVMI